MIKTYLKCTGSVLLFAMLFTSSISHANTHESLQRLYEMRLLTFSVLGDYYMFSGLEGDSRYNREVEAGIKRIETHFSEITKDGNPAGKLPSLVKVANTWQEFRKLLDTNRADFLVRGYADARLVGELSTSAMTLSTQLELAYNEFISSTNIRVSEWTQYCRQMGIIIQTITAEYAAHSTSSLGQVGRVELTVGGMDGQAEAFNALLAKLKAAPQPNKRIYKIMDQVGVKWKFIAKSIKNYNENAVPFLVSTYGDRIAQNLDTIGSHYSGTVTAAK